MNRARQCESCDGKEKLHVSPAPLTVKSEMMMCGGVCESVVNDSMDVVVCGFEK